MAATAAVAARDSDSWDVDMFSVEDPVRKVGGSGTTVRDRWEGEDEDEDVKDNWDDNDDEKKRGSRSKTRGKNFSKEKNSREDKRERQQKKRQEEIKNGLEEPEEPKVLTPEEQLADKLRLKKLQKESDLELAKETFVEIDDLKKITNSLTVLCSEKQKQEKQSKA
uniref:Eukaryotic translation initiation factor 3 30 kDa subunit n=1 Tax=Piliocolobus tephrosceles TaxID=591936 RepID=A0A8C9H0H7_9PRIM